MVNVYKLGGYVRILKALHFQVVSLMLLALMLTFSSFVEAACSFRNNSTQTINLNIGPVTVQRDTPIGSLLKQGNVEVSTIIECLGNTNPNYYTFTYNGAVSSGIAHVYNTNIPGVGMALWIGGSTGGVWSYFDNPAGTDNTGQGSVTYYNVVYRLVKTGNIISGALNSGQIGAWTVTGITPAIINVTGGAVTQVACAINTPTLNFPMGDVLASSFGTMAGFVNAKTNTQNLGLNCDADANINVMLQGTQNPDVSTTSVLSLTGQGDAGVARGVGIQLLYNGTPLALNNRITLRQSSGGQETFPITARYYQTRTSVSTGSANASATLDITYQ